MDLLSIRYFVTLAETMHFTKASQQLFISQQNLSQHIKKLEDHYGTELFIRKPKLKLTVAGEALYESFVHIINEEKNAQAKIDGIIQNNIGAMSIGASPYRGQFWIPQVMPEFIKKWPGVSTKISLKRSEEMERALITGDMDFFVGIKSTEDSLLRVIPLMSDVVYMVTTRSLMKQYFPTDTDQMIQKFEKGTSLAPFEEIPFIRLSSASRLRDQIEGCFQEAGFSGKTVLEVSGIDTMLPMLPANVGAFFCTGMRIPSLKEMYPDACFFPILYKGEKMYSDMSIVYHKDHYFSPYSLDFIEMLKNFFKDFAPGQEQ